MSEDTKKFTENRPAEAMQFHQNRDFSVASQDGKHAVSLIAFSGKELSHWWWGRCIFDRAGAVIPFSKIPVDYQHSPREVLGYLDTFGGTTALECSGYLVPFQDGDRVSEILHKKSMGVPYQCSVSLGDANFEFEVIRKGQTVTIYGQTFSGDGEPLVVFRKYEIHGVAICLYGSDSNTTVFHQNRPSNPDLTMSKEINNEARELANKFAKKYGEARGFKYFTAGLSEADADVKHFEDTSAEKDAEIAALKAKVAEYESKIAGLETQLAELQKGESTPVSAEDYAALKAEFEKLQTGLKRIEQAGGLFTGEGTPASGDAGAKPKKEFSAIPPNLKGFAAKFGPK